MKIDDFTLLYTLAKQGTVRAAAETLFISQPAVSQRLQQIERDWGHQLFLRTPRRLIPTPIGEEVLAFTQDYLRQEQLLKEKILQLKGEISGTLSLGGSSVIGQYILPSLLNQYMKNYPLVKINLMTGVSDEIAQGQYHVRITRGQSSNNKQAIKLFDDPLYLVADKRMAKSKPFIEHQADKTIKRLFKRGAENILQHHLRLLRSIKLKPANRWLSMVLGEVSYPKQLFAISMLMTLKSHPYL
nr:LysR family transcriptional regulator [Amphibacillus sediminis]